MKTPPSPNTLTGPSPVTTRAKSKFLAMNKFLAIALLSVWGSAAFADTLDDKINNAWTFAASQTLATASLPSLSASNGDVLYPSATSGYSTWNTTTSTSQASGWTAGFFPGQLWLLYNHTGNATFQTLAKKWTDPLQYSLNGSNPNKGIVLDHDAGFQTTCTWGNALLYSTDPAYNGTAAISTYVNNAGYLNSRFLPEANGGMIRCLGVVGSYDTTVAWPAYPALTSGSVLSLNINDSTVIDHMMGMQCLFEAHAWNPNATTNVYYQNAITDAVTSAYQFVRPDGSSYHAVWYYDPTASASLRGTIWGKGTVQGYANESCWSRGQAWGIYGFTQAYRYTIGDSSQTANNTLFLRTAENMANYFWNNLPANLSTSSANYVAGDYVPPSDFNAATGEGMVGGQDGKTWYDANNNAVFNQSVSGTNATKGNYTNDRFTGRGTYTLRDSSAAAVAASAMLQLAELEPDPLVGLQYFNEATAILGSLLSKSSISGTANTDYFAQNISGSALGAGLLLKYSGNWNSPYASASYGDYYLLEAMTIYQEEKAHFTIISGSLSATATKGSTFAYWITGSNNPGTYSATGLPAGLSVNASTGLISGVPTVTGTFSVNLSAINASGVGTATLTIVVQDPYSSWKSTWFTPIQLGNPAISGGTAAPAGDGIANLMKYALGLNPWIAYGGTSVGVAGVSVSGSNQYLSLTFTGVASDVSYRVEATSDLTTWSTLYISTLGAAPGTVVVSDTVPISGASRRFMRLRVIGP